MTHSLVLYLDTESPVYKSALSISKTSDLTWLSSPHGYSPDYYPVPRTSYTPVTSCNTS
jgi:hypothetical protein